MSELRLNLITREWVILKTTSPREPAEFMRQTPRPAHPERLDTCPFCPGNEDKTPGELHRIPAEGPWSIRVIPNRYPVLSPEGETTRVIEGTMRMAAGVGIHEVIIESPVHNTSPAFLSPEEVGNLLCIYRERLTSAYSDPRVEHVIIFKNHGPASGTSIVHPHTQLVGTPVVPVRFRDRLMASMHYFDDTGKCLRCDVLDEERKSGERIVIDTDYFTTFIPYAALSPFHIWIFPKRHTATFADITDEEIKDLAGHLRGILGRLHTCLDDPDFNIVITSSRPRDRENEFAHWYMTIIPRVTEASGFELGSGIYMNPVLPEKAAEFLRDAEAVR